MSDPTSWVVPSVTKAIIGFLGVDIQRDAPDNDWVSDKSVNNVMAKAESYEMTRNALLSSAAIISTFKR